MAEAPGQVIGRGAIPEAIGACGVPRRDAFSCIPTPGLTEPTMDPLDKLLLDFDRGRISRRDLLRALGLTIVALPAASLAQGRGADTTGRGAGGGGRGGGRGQQDATPAPPPFEATGWKTVWLDHVTYECPDYRKAAAFYSALMGWTLRSDDGKSAYMDIAEDVGSAIFRNSAAPAAPPPPPPPPVTAGDTAGRGGRGGRGGGGGRVQGRITNFAWGIEPWDTNKVEAELKKRGLNPVADHSGDFKSFHIKEPDGMDIQVTNGTRANRWKGPATAKLAAPPPFEPTGWKTLWLDHLSYGCSDQKKTVAFYQALLGWFPRIPGGGQTTVDIGDVGGAIIRGGNSVNHISFGIANWDPDKVEAELMKRNLGTPARGNPGHFQPDTGSGGEIHQSKFQSYHTPDAFGWDLQISNIIKNNRHDG